LLINPISVTKSSYTLPQLSKLWVQLIMITNNVQ